jgi:hypothetical protein
VLWGRVLSFQPDQRRGPLLAPLFARTFSASELEARVWLMAVDQPGPPQLATLRSSCQGKGRLSLFPVTHGHDEQPGSAVERSRLTRQVLDDWCARARESLLYEVSEQFVVKK